MILSSITTAALAVIGLMAFFAFPFFLIKIILFALVFRFMFRLLTGRRYAHQHSCMGRGHMYRRFNDMTDEERKAFCDGIKQPQSPKSPHTEEDGTVKPIIK